ncbi:hypothetical protein OQX61_16865 [Pedobacter sp. PLR]|uniref:hypothetical protein n=1 Tax=Pedobacter sp. PLR TaxID=2994465 RepID=UPI002245A723|nr:hypothetical protein [Pedobacter sp. PLR]MCX2452951.1 hypothetical protein [Pedobacter sp. PLR]
MMSTDKKILIAEIMAVAYFVLMFTGVIATINFPVIGAIVEMITIPLMLFQLCVFVIVGYTLLKKDKKMNYELAFSGVMSVGMICFFFITF